MNFKNILLMYVWLVTPFMVLGQNTVGLITIDTADVYDGYNIFYSHNQSTVYLTDNCGEIINTWDDDPDFRPGNAVYLFENGDIVRCKRPNNFQNDSIWAGGGGATVERLNWDNELIWSFELNNDTARLHHDIAVMPNGHVLMIAWEWKDKEEVIAAGRNPERLIQDKLYPDYILEYAPEWDSIVWEWHVWDHLIQDFDPTKENYGDVSAHPELVDINLSLEDEGFPDWMHSNSIDYNPVLDQIMISVPHFNEIWIIDHSTTIQEAASHEGGNSGKGGDLLFRYGNPTTYRSRAAQKLFFQHDARWIDDPALKDSPFYGGILIFNNRVGDNYSSVEIIGPATSIDGVYLSNESDGSPMIDRQKTIFHPDTFPLYSSGLSSAQLLPNGHLLTLAGRRGRAFEIDFDENRVVWEYVIPFKSGNPVSQGDVLKDNDNITFTFRRTNSDFGNGISDDLTPIGYIESNPNLAACMGTSSPIIELDDQEQLTIFPNPFNNELIMKGLENHRRIQIFNTLGHLLFSTSSAQSVMIVPTAEWAPGWYILQVDDLYHAKIIKH